ncbi:acyltransferase family protein [Thalassotalea agariperforans]
MQFRKDINGLRAIAVTAVVLFHFNASWMPGGYAGVDVFFVISGFLMTRIIFRGIEQENFSILKFYIARANRIIPALAILCLVLLIFGWLYLSPTDYKALGKHVGSSIGFWSNIVYWSESGYFDASSHEKWLLHTWSLSAEWQFYIIYPLVIVAIRKFFPIRAMKATVLVGALIGFIFCVIATYKWPDFSYFSLPTRAWEMLLGGVAYLYPIVLKEEQKKRLEWFGLALIIGSYFFISKETPWPGYLALFPVLGAFLIIQAQSNDSFITSNIISQKIGSWSYSIYLWHWPLVVSIYYFSLNQAYSYLGIILSVLLGFLSHKYIERIKFRSDFTRSFGYLTCKPLLISILLMLSSSFIYKYPDIIYYHIPKDIFYGMTVDKNTDDNGKYTWDKHRKLNKKQSFTQDKLKVLIIGDSQAGDFINILYETGISNDTDVISRIISKRCGVFYLDIETLDQLFNNQKSKPSKKIREKCRLSMSRIIEGIEIEDADIIILAMQWSDENVPFILKSLSNIRQKNITSGVYLIGGKAFDENIPTMLYNSYSIGMNINNYAFNKVGRSGIVNYQYQNDIFEKAQASIDVNYINMTNILCENKACSVVNTNNEPYYYDSGHLTQIGAKYLGEKIKSKQILPLSLYSK